MNHDRLSMLAQILLVFGVHTCWAEQRDSDAQRNVAAESTMWGLLRSTAPFSRGLRGAAAMRLQG